MKKIITITAAFLLVAQMAAAETVIVVDTNGNVLQKTITSGGTALVPNQIVTTETYKSMPQVNTTIIKETPIYNETYTYSNVSAGTAILAGITTGVIGGLVYNSLKHHHNEPKAHYAPAPKPLGPKAFEHHPHHEH